MLGLNRTGVVMFFILQTGWWGMIIARMIHRREFDAATIFFALGVSAFLYVVVHEDFPKDKGYRWKR